MSIFNYPKLKLFSLTFLFGIFLTFCKKEDKDLVPYVFVNFEISLNDPEFTTLNSPGNFIIVFDNVYGVNSTDKGIIIYRNNFDQFSAYDRNCTHDPSHPDAAVDIDSTGVILRCPVCNSEFTLYDGYVSKGPAKRQLKTYRVSFDGNNTLLITN